MNYDEAGAIIGRETLGGDRVQEFVGYRDTALAQAEPFSESWAKYGE